MRRLAMLCAVLVATAAPLAAASQDDWFVPLGPPPKAAPKRIGGGESFPPLPLPATPLRRSERKRQPSPPTLVGKVVWGESASFSFKQGGETQIADWNLCPADLQGVLGKAKNALGEPFGSDQVALSSFHYDPVRTPLLYVSGVRAVAFSDEQLARLRDFVQRGGTVFFDSVAGSPFFTSAARRTAQRLFPDRALAPLPADHPLFHLVQDVDRAGFPRNAPGERPVLDAIQVGSRAAVVVSPYGLGCGWDDREVPMLEQAVFYDVDTASRLGVNLIAYVVGYHQVAQQEAKPELFGALDEKRPANELVFAQIRHDAHWDVHPGAAAALLTRARRDSAMAVSLKRVAVRPGHDDLSSYPLLWLTGTGDLRFSEGERAALRTWLAGHGTLVIDNGLGLATFDAAVRRELAALLPGAQLQPIPPGHALMSAAAPVVEVRYSPQVQRVRKGLSAPWLEGVAMGGDIKVIYSPYDLAAGWDGLERPGALTWDGAAGTAMGLNLLVYALTH